VRRAKCDDQVSRHTADRRRDCLACESAVPGADSGFDEALVDYRQTVLAASEAKVAPGARRVTGEGGGPVGSDDRDRRARAVEVHIGDRGTERAQQRTLRVGRQELMEDAANGPAPGDPDTLRSAPDHHGLGTRRVRRLVVVC
jgi:hypothetical protein